jgi:hypothetical protein
MTTGRPSSDRETLHDFSTLAAGVHYFVDVVPAVRLLARSIIAFRH